MAKSNKTLLVTGAVAAIALVAGGFYYLNGPKKLTFEGIPVAKVARGPLRISVVERGSLKAKRTTTIRSELEGESKILYVVSEGKNVKEGELLIELDVSQQTERHVQQKISYEQAEASYVDAKEKLAIQINQSESNVKKAELALEKSQNDLKKWIEGTLPQKKETQDAKIKLSEQSLAQARERYEWSKKLFEAGFLTKTEFEHDQLEVNRAQIDLDLSKRELEILVTYEGPMESKLFTADVSENERELERQRRQAIAEKAQSEANLRAHEQTLELEREKLNKLERQIAKAKILAPADGVVVYASQQGGGRRQDEMITIGARVSEREELLELPDPSRMLAEAKFHESVVDMVDVGMPAIVTVDSSSDKPLPAKVTYLSVVPDSQSRWMNPDLRVYRSEVEISASTEDYRPQMSCAIEIVVQDIADAIYVPVQAIFRRGGRPVCYVMNGTSAIARNVELGLSNERNVQIKSGLEVGEQVLLALPPGLETDLSVESPKTQVGEVVDAQRAQGASRPSRGGRRGEGAGTDAGAAEMPGGNGGPEAGPPRGPGGQRPEGAGNGGGRRRGSGGGAKEGAGAKEGGPAGAPRPADAPRETDK